MRYRTLRLKMPMMRGGDVQRLQDFLGLEPDGIYGPNTKNAVIAYQLRSYITADGIVGIDTWSEIENDSQKRVIGIDNSLIFNGDHIEVPDGIQFLNYHAHSVPKVKTWGSIKEHRWLVGHENAGTTNIDKYLDRAARAMFCYHIVVCKNGGAFQLADLCKRVWHARRYNSMGIGVVFLNGYYPKLAWSGQEIIESQWWTHGKEGYAVPSAAQIKTSKLLFPFLADTLNIPFQFPTSHLGPKQPKVKNWLLGPRCEPGIIAHGDVSSHSDGRYILNELMAEKEPTFYRDPSGVCFC